MPSDLPYRELGNDWPKSRSSPRRWHWGFGRRGKLSLRIIRTAIDRVDQLPRHFWDYNDGASERRMGRDPGRLTA